MRRVRAGAESPVGDLRVGLALPTLQAAHRGSGSRFPVEIVIFIFYLTGVIWIQLSLVLGTPVFTLGKTCPVLFSLSNEILFLYCFLTFSLGT